MPAQQKKCPKCGEVKSLGEFGGNLQHKDGKRSFCRMCTNEAQQKWRKANPESARAISRRQYATNPEQQREKTRRWVEVNPERHRENARKWRIANPERWRESTRRAKTKMQSANYLNLSALFGPTCLDCGLKFPMQIFDYHHLDPATKQGKLDVSEWSWTRVEAYIQGCVQLCPTCHRMRHFLARKKPKSEAGATK